MIETDGEEQFREIQKHGTSSIFNEWEQRFIREVRSISYAKLTNHQKAVVTRLYGWLIGN